MATPPDASPELPAAAWRRPVVGLVLTGGGARSAYQIGVLRALAQMLPGARNPFPVIVGTSAGAVAASVLAAEAHAWLTLKLIALASDLDAEIPWWRGLDLVRQSVLLRCGEPDLVELIKPAP